MTEWGADTAWPNVDNMRQCIAHMGVNQVDVIRVNFFTDEPLQPNGQIGPNSKAAIDNQLSIAALAGSKPIALTPSTGAGTHSYYLDAQGNAIPSLWVALMEATQEYIGQPIAAVEPFNEPDWWGGQGTPQTLYDILVLLQSSPNFQGTELHAASTLSSDNAQWWYDQVAGPTTHGTLHQLGGSADSYINFINHVQASGDIAYNPELHSMAEVLYGCEYGLQGGIWWGAAMRARGILVNAVQGKRLGYAENRGTSSAAAVYRAPSGGVYGFAGSFERQGPLTYYRFVCTDQDVYFNGIGPIREFMYKTELDQQGGYFNIDNSPSLPALDGHLWKIVNRLTGEVLEVANGGTSDGDNIRTAADIDGLHQKWYIERTRDGYYALFNANSGRTAEVENWATWAGANVRQWGMADNLLQFWFIDDAGGGYFNIRNGHSNLYMDGDLGSDNVLQWDPNGQQQQQWQFVLADPPVNGSLKAHYEFEGNAADSAGSNNGSAVGSPVYTAGQVGLAIDLDGSVDYVDLPNDVHNGADITVAAWVNWDGGGAWQRIFDFGMGTDQYMFLTPSAWDGTMRFAITTGGNAAEEMLLTDALPVGQWVHVAVTIGANTGILYVDGTPRVAGQILLNPSDVIGGGQQNNYIGKSNWPDPLFDGRIDDFRIYDYALTSAEVAALASANPDTTPPAAPTGLSATAGDGSVALDWNNNGEPDLGSYTVYRSTTSGGGYSAIASGLGSSAYTDNTANNGTTYYYVVTATDTSSNESGFSSEVSATPETSGGGDPNLMHVSAITVQTVNAGKGNKRGQALVTILDGTGAPVQGATVTGTFSGDFNETQVGTTSASGVATLTTDGLKKGGVSFTFCVDDVSEGSHTYDPGSNVISCSSL